MAQAYADAAVRTHTEDALIFRARRRQLYPLADSLEMQEGLAEYTGERPAMIATGQSWARVARQVRDFQSNPTYVRSFAYATGPALGMLLDRFAADWRTRVRVTRDPARLLAEGIGLRLPRDLAREADRRARRYGFDVRHTVYPTGTFDSVWGRLELVSGGALLSNDQSTLTVAAPSVAPVAGATATTGDGWKLDLAPGWELRPSPDRAGSYLVVRAKP